MQDHDHSQQNYNYTLLSGNNDDVKVDMNNFERPSLPFLLDYGFRPPLLGNDVWLTPDQAAWTFNLPVGGRIRIVKDPVGLFFLLCIIFYWIYNVSCIYYIILLPRYYQGSMSGTCLLIFGMVAVLCVSSFFRASTLNPGALSSTETGSDWNLCLKCNMSRPPGTHHCRRCGQCVRKMDHHCPWINNCVGEDNQFAFVLLLLYTYALSIFTVSLDICYLFDFIPCPDCPEIEVTVLGLSERRLLWISLIMAVFMMCSSFSLFILQQISIILEFPSMEFNRMQMEFFYTQKLPTFWPTKKKSAMSTYRSTCGKTPMLCWMFPCRKRSSSVSSPRERLI